MLSFKGGEVMLRWVVLALLIGFCASAGDKKVKTKAKTQSLARGWGNAISWAKSYEEALAKAFNSKKPVMVIHHLPDCPHSQALKKAFVADKTVQKMAKGDFIMLNVVEETADSNLAPDGYYVPRIVFVDPSLTVRADITGKNSGYRYSYNPGDMQLLVKNMKKAKKLLPSKQHIEL
ncbi:anterior gradient 1 isoform 2-T2 [Pholidichthys leucotaenia]